MTSSNRPAIALALPLLLLPPLLLSACSTAAPGSTPSAHAVAATSGTSASSPSSAAASSGTSSGPATGAALCAAVPAADLAAAAKSGPLTPKVPVGTGGVECNWSTADSSTHFSAVWADSGDNVFDQTHGALGNQHPTATTIAGHSAGVSAAETEVDFGDHQLDVFTVHGATSAQLTAVATVLAQKLG